MSTMEWQKRIESLYNNFLLSLGQCDLCGNCLDHENIAKQTLICSSCFIDLPLFKQAIIQKDLLNWPSINKALPNNHFDHLFCLSPYIQPFSQWLPQFKYQGRFELASFFARLLIVQWQKHNVTEQHTPVDLILSVPLHSNKWQVRGYNQAHLLAKPIAKYMQIPYDETAIIRTKNNISQVGQTGGQRRRNLANIFTLAKTLTSKPQHVILVDDVLTTGSTANEISMLLKSHGVKEVTVMTVCLTLPSIKN
jgi:ComF family protein